jgi:hypothetical protein
MGVAAGSTSPVASSLAAHTATGAGRVIRGGSWDARPGHPRRRLPHLEFAGPARKQPRFPSGLAPCESAVPPTDSSPPRSGNRLVGWSGPFDLNRGAVGENLRRARVEFGGVVAKGDDGVRAHLCGMCDASVDRRAAVVSRKRRRIPERAEKARIERVRHGSSASGFET